MKFSELIDVWRLKKYNSSVCYSSQVGYERIIKSFFDPLLEIDVKAISPKIIDEWIQEIKARGYSSQRKDFDHELTLLKSLLHFYQDSFDDADFFYPIKKRHEAAVKITNNSVITANKDLRENAFKLFSKELLTLEHGLLWHTIAVVQYYQAQRISETAAIVPENIYFDKTDPKESTITIDRSIVYLKDKGEQSYLQAGFKNGDLKLQPMFYETYQALQNFKVFNGFGKKFVFERKAGEFIEYRHIQTAYNAAFKKAGLPFRSTHVLRHGGCRCVYNQTKGDIRVAAQLLGNSDPQVVSTYAKSYNDALSDTAKKIWESKESSETPPIM